MEFKDVNQWLANQGASILEEWLPGGYWENDEYWPCNPTRNDKNPGSFSINPATGAFSDFADASTKGGDYIALYAMINHVGQNEARLAIVERYRLESDPVTLPAPKMMQDGPTAKKKTDKKPSIWPVDERHALDFSTIKADNIYTYRTAAGELLGYVIRRQGADGKKATIPLTWNGTEWHYQGWGEYKPIYKAELLAKQPTAPVLIVEGEKTTDAAALLFPDYVCISWVGGSNTAEKVDWSILKNRKVVIIPDNDQPGAKAAIAIKKQLPHAHVVQIPMGFPEAWDVADPLPLNYTFAQFKELLTPPKPKETDNLGDNRYYRLLGSQAIERRAVFYFYNKRNSKILAFKTTQMDKSNLQELAPVSFFEPFFPGVESKTALFDRVREDIIGRAYRMKIYDPDKVRGRGAWMDDSRVVIHTGDALLVNGASTSLQDIQSKHVYEQHERLDLFGPGLSAMEAQRFVDFCNMFSWDQPIYGLILAGWIFLAPVCGALKWRPHLWLTGPIGSGKSWIFQNVIQDALGDFCLQVQSETTEAGLRQRLGSDALPVIFDEVESENRRSDARIQNVMALMRQASSEGGGSIVKGSATGEAKEYRIRSMFAFASVLTGAYQSSDKSRIANVSLQNTATIKDSEANFTKIKATRLALYNPDFLRGLKYRAVEKLPLILESIDIFSALLAEKVGTRRLGDQYGTLLAGAWAMMEDAAPTVEEATAIVNIGRWEDEKELASELDHNRMLKHLMETPIKAATSHGIEDTTIGELVAIAASVTSLSTVDASTILARYGLLVYKGYLYIQNSHQALERTFRDTPWPRNWKHLLKSCNGYLKPETPIYFGKGFGTHRCVAVPVANALNTGA